MCIRDRNLFTAKGKTGENEQWVLTSTSSLGACAVDDVYEFMIPWAEIGLAPRYTTRIKAVSYTHLRAHETKANLVCRLLLEPLGLLLAHLFH